MKMQLRLLPWSKVVKAALVINIMLKEFCNYFQRKGKGIYLNLCEFCDVKILSF